jgi:hypothetical protein
MSTLVAPQLPLAAMVAQRDAAWAVYWEYAPDEVIAENEAWKDRVFQRV